MKNDDFRYFKVDLMSLIVINFEFFTVRLFFDITAMILMYNKCIKLIHLTLIGLRMWRKTHFWNLEKWRFSVFQSLFMSLIVIHFEFSNCEFILWYSSYDINVQ